MVNSALRWGLFIAATVIAGPTAYALMHGVAAVDGSHHITALASAAPITGLLRAIVCIVIAALMGGLASRFASLNTGLLCGGVVLAWAASACGTVDGVFRAVTTTGASAAAISMAIEAAILGLLSAAAVYFIVICRPPVPAGHSTPAEAPPSRLDFAITVVIAAIAGLIAAWLVAQNMLKGQAIATGAVTTVIGAGAAALIVRRSSAVAVMLGLTVIAAAGPIVALITHTGTGSTGLVARAASGTLVHVARLTPLDWLAGGLIGLPVGRSLALWLGEMQIKPEAGAPATT